VFSHHSRKLNKTTKCQHCDIEVALPFKCSYCHGYFCSEHRLPENHECPEYWRARAPREAAEPTKPAYKYTITYLPRPTAKVFWFSTTELKHLALGALLVMGVGLSFVLPQFADRPEILASLATVFTFSFLLHEFAHKLSAQRFGLWAEFRLTMFGALLTLLSMLPTPFKIISPGAVMIAGPMTKESAGKTALAGPFINIVLSTLCIMIALTTQNFVVTVAVFGAWINALIALFNLIPFGVLDGLKVFWWNKMAWAVAFGVSLPLTIFAFWTLATL